MTTIATDGAIMAADGRVSGNGSILNERANKLFRLPDGSVVGIAGDAEIAIQAVEALASAIETGETPSPHKGDYVLLRLLTNGRVLYYYEKLLAVEVAVPAAVGSGHDLALGAMLSGKHPVDAIKIAKLRDVSTGGRIRSLKLRP